MKISQILILLAIAIGGCADTGQDRTSVALYVSGTTLPETILTRGEVPITIQRAELAFGPLYLCAGAQAGHLCETARLEWLDTIVVDVTQSELTLAGDLYGVTGTVQSWMYDLGISSQLTQSDPFVLDAAESLGGNSLQFEATATIDGIAIPFNAAIPIQQTEDTELGVPVIRKSTSDEFFHDVLGTETRLVVRFDAVAWVTDLDLRGFVSYEQCAVDGAAVVCDGTIERTCEDGTETSARDCADSGQICQPKQGCTNSITIDQNSQGYRSLRNSLVSGRRPTFNWE
jgi:hypothetical protein